jgi:hypothetical protein
MMERRFSRLKNFAAGDAGEYLRDRGGDCVFLTGLMDFWINAPTIQ